MCDNQILPPAFSVDRNPSRRRSPQTNARIQNNTPGSVPFRARHSVVKPPRPQIQPYSGNTGGILRAGRTAAVGGRSCL